MNPPNDMDIYYIAKGKLNNVIAEGLKEGKSLDVLVADYRSSIDVLIRMEDELEKAIGVVMPKEEAWRYLLWRI